MDSGSVFIAQFCPLRRCGILCGMGVWRRVYEVMIVAMGGKGTQRQYGVAVGGGRRWSKGQTKAVSADCRARWRKRQERTTAQRAKDKDK